MALKFVQRVAEGESAPAGYGIAWWEWADDRAVTMPVPFNVLARVVRDAWLYLKSPGEVPINPRAAYFRGYRIGRESMADDLKRAGVLLPDHHNDGSTPCA